MFIVSYWFAGGLFDLGQRKRAIYNAAKTAATATS